MPLQAIKRSIRHIVLSGKHDTIPLWCCSHHLGPILNSKPMMIPRDLDTRSCFGGYNAPNNVNSWGQPDGTFGQCYGSAKQCSLANKTTGFVWGSGILPTMQLADATFSCRGLPIGTKNDLPVEPREATTHELQHTPKDPITSPMRPWSIECTANLGHHGTIG